MTSLVELEQPCGRCGHQQAEHTGGARPDGWAIYDRAWNDATGSCSTKGCDCPRRVSVAIDTPNRKEPTGVDIAEQLAEELKDAVTDAVLNTPRSLQVALGPSEIGAECQHQLARKLLDWPRVNFDTDPLPSFIGTAAHAAMAEALERANQRRPGTWLVEHRVDPSDTLSGHCDTFRPRDATVEDHKFVGPYNHRKYKEDGPPRQYVVQVNLYALGWENAGYSPKNVAIAFFPRGGSLKNLYVWSAPYDRQMALDALARLETIRQAVIALDPEAHPERWAVFPMSTGHHCSFCPWWKPGTADLSLGCPSEPGAVNPRTPIEDLIG